MRIWVRMCRGGESRGVDEGEEGEGRRRRSICLLGVVVMARVVVGVDVVGASWKRRG